MMKILIMFSIALTLLGCNTQPTVEVRERIVDRFVKVPVELTEKVRLPVPFNPDTYSTLPWEQKESQLFDLLGRHSSSVVTCNTRLGGIENWSSKQAIIYSNKP